MGVSFGIRSALVGHRTFKYRGREGTSNFRLKVSDFGLQTSDFQILASDFRLFGKDILKMDICYGDAPLHIIRICIHERGCTIK